jgi:hypothetical protein
VNDESCVLVQIFAPVDTLPVMRIVRRPHRVDPDPVRAKDAQDLAGERRELSGGDAAG